MVVTLIPVVNNKSIEQLAQEITIYEGFYYGSVSDRNNNPGNLRHSPYQDGTRDGFAYFETYEAGWNALVRQLTLAASGGSGVYRDDMTLYEFFNVYAPSGDSNNPNLYASIVIRNLGIPKDTQLKDFLSTE